MVTLSVGTLGRPIEGDEVLLVYREDADLWKPAGTWRVDAVFDNFVRLRKPWLPFWKKVVPIRGIFSRVEVRR